MERCSSFPRSALAQTATNTEAAIAELRQLLAEQRAALDQPGSDYRGAGAKTGRVARASRRRDQERWRQQDLWLRNGAQDPVPLRAKPHGCRARPGPAGCGRFSRRVPRLDPHSRDRVGFQARRSGAHGRRSHAERPRDRRSVRHLLDPRRGPTSGRGGAHGLLTDRQSLEHRAADAESERADAPVHRERLRRQPAGHRGFGTPSSRRTASSSARPGPRFRILRPNRSGLTSRA